ncbi:solute carrier organic anion transporter family member 1C1-like [Pantherophis guttatus]|uniref:Solute carrier organic anion transporter family member n=1 Tax=Pantherophis guttatus TaxID=94885 RepID=A0ABM3Z962_PANGU|nr:solute carrier organic anion transporter family member 1C1-like [Pantherophis guttatus]
MDGKTASQQAKENPFVLDKTFGSHPTKVTSLSISQLKIFLGALAFSFFAKAFSGSYMKSMMTQIERRFEISSSVVGLIDGSFEIGNLLVMVLVSYLGPRVHRPKVIATGCLIMTLGSFLSMIPHFIMGRYNYKSITVSLANSSTSVSPVRHCGPHNFLGHFLFSGCEKMASSYLWVFVLAGNLLRGIGEAPIMPLGMSYIDDFATEENSAFYIGTVRSVGMFGPSLGFLLGAFCANLWVDIGAVNPDTLTINSKDMRWVGAWWLGMLICGATSFMSSLPFWFLPYSLPQEGEQVVKKSTEVYVITQVNQNKMEAPRRPGLKVSEIAKDFFPTLKKLFGNPIFLIYLLLTILQYNSLVGIITFESKFMEQQFNISVSRAIFLIGVIVLPITIVGMFLGGFIIKKFKLHIAAMAKFACITFVTGFLLNLFYFGASCQVLQVAGLTVNYSGIEEVSFSKEKPLSACNSNCGCEATHWDPVCGDNGITYMNPCLAGCKTSVGSGKDLVFQNCSCLGVSGAGNFSAVLGQCPRDNCTKEFPYFLVLLSITAFILSLGGTPTYMLMFRSVSPDLKSFAVGIEALCGRVLGGLPAPIYFGALIDQTCLKWGVKTCGGSGACRVYDTKAFRNVYLGVVTALRFGSFFLYIILCTLIIKRCRQGNQMMNDIKTGEVSDIKLSNISPKTEVSSHKEMQVTGDTPF